MLEIQIVGIRCWLLTLLFALLVFNAPPSYAEEKAASSEHGQQGVDQSSNAAPQRGASQGRERQDKEPEEPEAKKKPVLRKLSPSGRYVDLVQPINIDPLSLAMGTPPTRQKSFYKLCRYVDDLGDQQQVRYVLLDLSAADLAMNSAQLDELTRRINRLKAGGKKIFAWVESPTNVQLALAAACDRVFMADFGGVDMPSTAMESIFYRDAMDLLGVKASIVRAGNFKGAVEPYVNPEMSDHLRKHYSEMLASMNDAQIDRLARGRGLKVAEIRDLQRQRFVLPREALAAGVVDVLAPYSGMRKAVEDEIGEEVEWTTPKTAARKQVSIIQLMGQMMSGPRASLRYRDNTIAVLHLSGTIIDGLRPSAGNLVAGPVVKLIDSMTAEDKVKGVVVRINSPGGSATASEAVRQALIKLAKEKPTVVSMGSQAASGGYWISCIDAPVYAEKGTLTGSIGVFSMKLSFGSLMRRVGVHLESITLDDAAGAFSLDRPWDDDEVSQLQKSIDDVYGRFLDIVSESRGIPREALDDLAGGRVWSGSQAKQLRLVDHLGGVDDCVSAVARKAKLEDYQVVHRPVAQSGLNLAELLGRSDENEIWNNVAATAWKLLLRRGLSLEATRTLLQSEIVTPGKPKIWLMQPMEISIK